MRDAPRTRRSAFAAFDQLVEARLDASYRLASVLLSDPIEAQDATHDAIARAQRRWPGLRDPSAAIPWLDRILVNECRDRLRRRERTGRRVVRLAGAEPLAGVDSTLGIAEREVLRRSIATLSADHRIVVVLRFFADFTVEETANRLEVPVGTVKSRLHYALRELRAAWEAGLRSEDER